MLKDLGNKKYEIKTEIILEQCVDKIGQLESQLEASKANNDNLEQRVVELNEEITLMKKQLVLVVSGEFDNTHF